MVAEAAVMAAACSVFVPLLFHGFYFNLAQPSDIRQGRTGNTGKNQAGNHIDLGKTATDRTHQKLGKFEYPGGNSGRCSVGIRQI